MGIVIFYSYIVVLSRFKTVLHEFESLFYWFETLIFTTTPLLARYSLIHLLTYSLTYSLTQLLSIILTWFLCVEIPVIDMSYCFCTVYFVYMYILAYPRKSSHPDLRNIVGTVECISHSLTHSLTYLLTHLLTHSLVKAELDGSNASRVMPYVLPPDIITLMYIVPVVISPLLHCAIHWNTLQYWNLSDLISLLTSALIPIVLMLYLADKHNPYYNRTDNNWQVLTHSLTHSLTRSLTYLLTHSLTHSEVYKHG